MKKAIRPAILKWRQTEAGLILCAVRWYLRYSLSLRDAAVAKRLFCKALTFSDASCENSRICGRIRPVHNGPGAVGKSTVIAVETDRRNYFGRIQTETPLDIGARPNITR